MTSRLWQLRFSCEASQRVCDGRYGDETSGDDGAVWIRISGSRVEKADAFVPVAKYGLKVGVENTATPQAVH